MAANFPFKLHQMLKSSEAHHQNDIISWTSDGKMFTVYDLERFSDEIMPDFFSSNKFKTFQRNLNLWGFKTVTKGHLRGSRYHPFFIIGSPELCFKMKRVRVKGTGIKKSQDCSDGLVKKKTTSVEKDDFKLKEAVVGEEQSTNHKPLLSTAHTTSSSSNKTTSGEVSDQRACFNDLSSSCPPCQHSCVVSKSPIASFLQRHKTGKDDSRLESQWNLVPQHTGSFILSLVPERPSPLLRWPMINDHPMSTLHNRTLSLLPSQVEVSSTLQRLISAASVEVQVLRALSTSRHLNAAENSTSSSPFFPI